MGIVKFSLLRIFYVLLIYQFLRFGFFLLNESLYATSTNSEMLAAWIRGVRYDMSAICLVNGLWLILEFIPVPQKWKTSIIWRSTLDLLFLVPNLSFILLNMVDAEYFQFTGKRFTAESFSIINDIQSQTLNIFIYYWYYIAICIAVICLFTWMTIKTSSQRKSFTPQTWKRGFIYLSTIIIVVAIGGRGGFQKKPIIPANAYVNQKINGAQLSLNSTFTILKSLQQTGLPAVKYYDSWSDTMAMIKEAKHSDSEKIQIIQRPSFKNVIILIQESFSLEYMGLKAGEVSYTPFLNNLSQKGTFYTQAFANGRRSIDGLPSIISGLPGFMTEPFITSQYQGNQIISLPAELSKAGYDTAFFHGGYDGTMYFNIMTNKAGFKSYFGESSYPHKQDLDGHWGIYDEPFYQFIVDKVSALEKPFFVTAFSLSSHNPYKVPEKYKSRFPKGTLEIHESIGYADYALERFFESASKKDWFKDTLFIITGDHTSKSYYPEYQNHTGRFRVPIIYYQHNQQLPLITSDRTTQHIDIMPTIMDLLQLPSPKTPLFGNSLVTGHAPTTTHSLIFENNHYSLIAGPYLWRISLKGEMKGFNWQKDPHLLEPIVVDSKPGHWLKAYIQMFNNGLIKNSLSSTHKPKTATTMKNQHQLPLHKQEGVR